MPSSCDLIYGIQPVTAALRNSHRDGGELWITENALKRIGNSNAAAAQSVTIVPAAEISSLLARNSGLKRSPNSRAEVSHQGVLYRVASLPEPELNDALDSPLLIALDEIEDAGNLGSIVRAAAVFGVGDIIIPSRRSVGTSTFSTIAKVSCGAAELVRVIRCGNFARTLNIARKNGYHIIGFDEKGSEAFSPAMLDNKTMLVFGSESSGMRRLTVENCDVVTKLDFSSSFSTLNITQSVVSALTICRTAPQ